MFSITSLVKPAFTIPLLVILAFLLVACGAQLQTNTPQAPTVEPTVVTRLTAVTAPTPDIDATVRAAIAATIEVPATIRAAVAATLEAQTTRIPAQILEATTMPTVTSVPTAVPTPVSIPADTPTPPPTSTRAPVPTQTPEPLPSPTPKPLPTSGPPPAPKPASAATVLSVAPIEVIAGATLQAEAIFQDKEGNVLSGGKATWKILDPNAGSIDSSGRLTAGEVAGSFVGAVEARAADVPLVATATVSIMPGPLEQLGIAPEGAELGIEMSQQFVAVGVDQFGNRIPDLKITWSLEKGGGTLDANGMFMAGSDPGTYPDTLKATASHGDVTRSASTNVIVEPDRIAFISRRGADNRLNLYIMDADGSNVIQITKNGAFDPSWSPDGRRIAYDWNRQLYAINAKENLAEADVDNWRKGLLSERFRADDPVWSPDGTKIAFQSFEHATDNEDDPGSEIYVMDLDSGNRIRLTDNSYRDDKPSWSPDGSKLIFISDSEGDSEEQIFVIDADGSNLRQVSNGGDNSNPKWSPDGTQIVFQSRPSSRDWWTLSIIDSRVTVGGGRNITSPEAGDYNPTWSQDNGQILFWSFRDSEFRDAKTSEEWDKGAEIYTMDRTGRGVRRLTNNEAWDGFPVWAPRKAGIEVGDSSIVFANSSSLEAMSVSDVTSNARPSVVRIKTDRGSGSGFVIDTDGLILTNNHVIRDAQDITVFLEDGTDYSGTVLGRDMVRDLAKIKIEASDLPVLEFGDLSNVIQGQQIVVLGFPLGNTELSITSGFVSTTLFDPGRNVRFVQTDSAINAGNSGGPLLNLQGQVIGVVSSRIVGSGVTGLGRAISANTVLTYLDRLEEREISKPPETSQVVRRVISGWPLNMPSDVIAVDRFGNVFVADTANHRVQKLRSDGRFVLKWGTRGKGEGQFNSPGGIAVDWDGFVYVADTGNHRIQKFSADGRFVFSSGTQGSRSGQFNSPGAIVVDKLGNFYVADTGNHRVQLFDSIGRYSLKWGARGKGDGQFNSPRGVALDSRRNVFVADTGNHRIQKFTPTGQFVFTLGTQGSGIGELNSAGGVDVDPQNNVLVIDTGNHRLQKFGSSGQFLSTWGTQGEGDAQFNLPGGIALDSTGFIYVADTRNNRVLGVSPIGEFFREWGKTGTGEGEFQWTS